MYHTVSASAGRLSYVIALDGWSGGVKQGVKLINRPTHPPPLPHTHLR
jgi:hypothetical protein